MTLLVGKPAVEAALTCARREIRRVVAARSLAQRPRAAVESWADRAGCEIDWLDSESLSELTGVENHGGVAAEVSRRRFETADDLEAALARLARPPLVFLLEAFHDAHNLGYALRCLEAFGVDAVWLEGDIPDEGKVAQSAHGALDRLPLARLDDARETLGWLDRHGIESLAATPGAIRSVDAFDLRAPVGIAVGGEFQGLSAPLRRGCRHAAHVPMASAVGSLPASHAAAILAAEAARQRRLGGSPGPLWPRRVSTTGSSSGRREPDRGPRRRASER